MTVDRTDLPILSGSQQSEQHFEWMTPPGFTSDTGSPSITDRIIVRAAVGLPGWARDHRGAVFELPLKRWAGGHRACPADRLADDRILASCTGPTLDLGCGPGRLTATLHARGTIALGVDTSAAAVNWTRRRGGTALRQDIFAPLPDTGGWAQVLLADGNIGIGGDPLRVLHRVRELLAPGGIVIVEVDPPGTGLRREWLRWETEHAVSAWFPWARIDPITLTALAAVAGIHVVQVDQLADRHVVALTGDEYRTRTRRRSVRY